MLEARERHNGTFAQLVCTYMYTNVSRFFSMQSACSSCFLLFLSLTLSLTLLTSSLENVRRLRRSFRIFSHELSRSQLKFSEISFALAPLRELLSLHQWVSPLIHGNFLTLANTSFFLISSFKIPFHKKT